MTSTEFAVAASNFEQLRAWDGSEGAYWAAHAERFDAAVAGYDESFFDAADIQPTDAVLDVGCGTGGTTREAARRAAQGVVLGVDLSAAMIDVAGRQADRERLTNARFEQADAQVHPFEPATFDVVISRTGAMFFGDPSAAFSNLARTLRPGGRLVLLVWQPSERNEWIRQISLALSGRPAATPPPGAPSPFSLSDPHVVTTLLTGSGFENPGIEALERPMWFGRSPGDAEQFLLGLAGWMIQGDEARARAALLRTLEEHASPAGVAFGSAAWLITSRRRLHPPPPDGQ